ncbi:MAG TPA: trypsin-like peptidase domain-containing protein [Candidatus Dormibacteraeota bacterium]
MRRPRLDARLFLILAPFTLAGFLLAACSSPVRLATSSEIGGSPAPAASQPINGSAVATPSPGASPGGGPSASPNSSGSLGQLQAAYRAVVDAVLPSVVEIDVGNDLGSGVVLDSSGDIVTNAHVVEGARTITVKSSSGQTYSATVVGTYPSNDLAVIKVSSGSGDGVSGLKPATFGDSSQVHVGDIALAVGSPLGLLDSVTEGIVSGVGRSQDEGNGVTLTDLIQTTAAINPGNSGGALVDISGHVIGIPTLGATGGRGGAVTGIGFAISSNQALSVVKQPASGAPKSTPSPTPSNGAAYLGIVVTSDSAGGVVISSVAPGGPADNAGVPAGATILTLGGRAVTSPSTVSQILSGFRPGQTIALTVDLPTGGSRTFRITLGTHP